MNSLFVIGAIVACIILLLLVGAPLKSTRFLGQGVVKLGIGILFLFFFNVFGGSLGLHIPINAFTVIVSGFLGVFGIASLTAIQLFIV